MRTVLQHRSCSIPKKYKISANDDASISDHSLYEGSEVSSAVTRTFVWGTLVALDGEVVGEDGHGVALYGRRYPLTV